VRACSPISFQDGPPLRISGGRRIQIACGSETLDLHSSQGRLSLEAAATLRLVACDVRFTTEGSGNSGDGDGDGGGGVGATGAAAQLSQMYAAGAGSLLDLVDSSVQLPQQVRCACALCSAAAVLLSGCSIALLVRIPHHAGLQCAPLLT
jgi:hypothetical protein